MCKPLQKAFLRDAHATAREEPAGKRATPELPAARKLAALPEASPEPDLLARVRAAERTIGLAGDGGEVRVWGLRNARPSGFPCCSRPLLSPVGSRAWQGSPRGPRGRGAGEHPPRRAGMVAAHLRVSRAGRQERRRCLRLGAGRRRGRGRRHKGVGPRGPALEQNPAAGRRTDLPPGEGGRGGSAPRTRAPTRDPSPKMPVRGDRGFPPRREMSGWLHVSALLRPARLGEGSRGESLRARGGLPGCAVGGWRTPNRRWG